MIIQDATHYIIVLPAHLLQDCARAAACIYIAFFQIIQQFDLANMEQKTRITVAFISSRGLDPEEMEEDEDEEEDDDDDDFDFSTAGIKSKLPGKRIVEMKVITSNSRRKILIEPYGRCWSWAEYSL